ncbi:ESX secretion-associated protein EspG [Rhodococcus tibetensis]|uniref:ESX secretion-associated protein EspG n=1 Tax=Rhodococcus tibetensis TaxID=2965064 RepID=A0ABT1QJX9_9NOCA|nr:ESX secretion-associated protein EspG [Rhodococcus sp. FXJ9.536]MCQ4122601.1 ESX secretion-associated protein EspG [Rhodococcus sp. FXJ9.536]
MNSRLTSAQFMSLWEATDLDRMPYPLLYRSAAATADGYTRQQRELEEWRIALDDPELGAAIQVLRNPSVSVTVFAPAADPDSGVRRRGSIRGRVAVVAEQLSGGPGRGDIRLDMNTATDSGNVEWLITRMLHDLPDCTPGRTPSLSAHSDDLENGGIRSSVLQAAQASDGALLRRLVTRPRTGIGYICVRGPRRELDEPVLDELTWIDVEADGRYLYHQDHRVHLRSATDHTVREELGKRLGAALAEPSPSRR